ncbi:MAG: MBOAT family O-acyltransferase [bacterium]
MPFIASCFIDWYFGRFLAPPYQGRVRKLSLTLLLFVNLGLLAYFKYANFFLEQVNWFIGKSGMDVIRWDEIALPLGISFFTFHKITYLLDIQRGTSPIQKKFSEYLVYIFAFPQLIAGPIIRYHDIASQLEARAVTWRDVERGLFRFIIGLSKKTLIANQLAPFADAVFHFSSRGLVSPGQAWLGILCYTLQIYYDFSGYSDMAIGMGKMLGFDYLENFNRPYLSQSITEFWKRWHISLTNFFRDYLYIPLGGNRRSRGRTYLNLWIVFLLSGLWHGANWTFLVWGAYHGFFLTLDRLFLSRWLAKWNSVMRMAGTFLLVSVSWVFFRANNLTNAIGYLQTMFGFYTSRNLMVWSYLGNMTRCALILALLVTFFPSLHGNGKIRNVLVLRQSPVFSWMGCGVLLLLSLIALANGAYNPFIYFQF